MMGFDKQIFRTFNKDWALVTAGPIGNYNTMTISWGGLGTLWRLSVATVYVKPCRYTHQFLEKYDRFTLSFFTEEYREDLMILGSKSGRDGDKVALTSLTPVALDGAVTFAQASQTILCQKIYRQDMDLSAIPQFAIDHHYQTEAPHTIFIGKVLNESEL